MEFICYTGTTGSRRCPDHTLDSKILVLQNCHDYMEQNYIIRRQAIAGFKFMSYFSSYESEFIILMPAQDQWHRTRSCLHGITRGVIYYKVDFSHNSRKGNSLDN